MRRPARYNTRNGKAILSYLASEKDTFVTAAQVAEHLKHAHGSVSRPTVYRQLDKLAGEGKIRRYVFNNSSVSMYQYVSPDEREHNLPHLKCKVCDNVFNLECDEVSHISRHISESHAFQVNESETVFYGTCKTCTLSRVQENARNQLSKGGY